MAIGLKGQATAVGGNPPTTISPYPTANHAIRFPLCPLDGVFVKRALAVLGAWSRTTVGAVATVERTLLMEWAGRGDWHFAHQQLCGNLYYCHIFSCTIFILV